MTQASRARRVLFIYGFAPSGHARAASALAQAMRESGAEVELLDFASDLHPILGRALARAYHALVERLPSLWRIVYDRPALAWLAERLSGAYLGLEGGRLAVRAAEFDADLIVCAHALSFYTAALERGRGKIAAPVAAVLTDFGVHTYWTRLGAQLYLAPNEEAARILASRGAGRVAATGIPIDPCYEDAPSKAEARRRLGLSEHGFVVMLSGGSKAMGPMEAGARALLDGIEDARLLVACGGNGSLFESLAGLEGDRLARFGPLEPPQMMDLLCASDLHVGKPGGITCAESLAVGLPMLLLSPIPGQEERNAAHLIAGGAALGVASPGALASAAGSLLRDAARLFEMSRRARALGRPDSARAGAAALERLL